MSRTGRLAIWVNQSCEYCYAPATHADHFIPLARGGKNGLANLVACCTQCGHDKGSLAPAEWFAVLRVRGAV